MVLFSKDSTFPNLWSYLRPIVIDAMARFIQFDPAYNVDIPNLHCKRLVLRSDTTAPSLIVAQPQGAVVSRFLGPSSAVLEIRSDGSLVGNATINDILARLLYSQAVVGDLKWSSRTGDFHGWLLCDGRSLAASDYPDLVAVIGTSFGGGEGTFQLPDAQAKVLAASGSGPFGVGAAIGSMTQTLGIPNLPAHSHTGTTAGVGNHSHTYQDAYFAEATGGVGGPKVFGTSANCDGDNSFKWRQPDGTWSNSAAELATTAAGAHTHAFTTNNTGSGQPFDIVQPTLVIGNLYIFSGRV